MKHRKKLKRSKSRREFARKSRTHPKNRTSRLMRGGGRL